MATVHDVAAYILQQRGPMSTMKLQKLCYYSQGWALAWDERPLFDVRMEAWANGPVITDLYRHHRGLFAVSAWSLGNAANVVGEDKDTVDAVLAGYGDLSGQQLSDMTHAERPWLVARGDLPNGARCQRAVSVDDMQDFFGGIHAARSEESSS